MIGVEGQYLFSFELGDKKDFISEPDLISFITIETAGFSLPTFELTFNSTDESIMPLLNEGTPLKVKYGATRENMTDVTLRINNTPMERVGLSERSYTISGFCHELSYVSSPNNSISSNTSGLSAIIPILEKYFRVTGNIKTSADKQRWIQARTTDAFFAKDTILHSLAKNNSFFATAITTEREFIIKDIKEFIRANKYDWKFTSNVQEKNDISYDPHYLVEDRSGIIASLVGYGREKIVYDIENNSSKKVLEKSQPLLSLSRDLEFSKEIQKRNASLGIVNENVHSQYHEAYQRNITNLLTLSSISLTASIGNNLFVPIKPLDLIMFKDTALADESKQSAEYHSGLYLASTVTKELMQKRYTTTVEMCREAMNQVRA